MCEWTEYRQVWKRVGAFQGFVGLSPDYTDETFPDFPALVGAVLLSGFDVFYLKCAPTGLAPRAERVPIEENQPTPDFAPTDENKMNY